jgi:uncharacterized protein (TIGR02722 family)
MNHIRIIGAAAVAAALVGCATNPTYRDASEVRTYSLNFTASDYEQSAAAMARSLKSDPNLAENLRAFVAAHGNAKPKIVITPIVNNTRQMTIHTDVINDAIRTEIIGSGLFRFVGNEQAVTNRKFAEGNSVLVAPGASSGFSNQTGADYILSATLTQLDDEGGRNREKVYILAMQLDNLYTGETEWMAREPIRKYSQRAGIGW